MSVAVSLFLSDSLSDSLFLYDSLFLPLPLSLSISVNLSHQYAERWINLFVIIKWLGYGYQLFPHRFSRHYRGIQNYRPERFFRWGVEFLKERREDNDESNCTKCHILSAFVLPESVRCVSEILTYCVHILF